MDASVGFLLGNLKQLVEYQVDLIGNAKKELLKLNEELGKFNAILVEMSRISKKGEIFENREKRIREAVYDIEDVIDECVTKESARIAKKKYWWNKVVDPLKGGSLAEKVRSIREDTVKPLMEEFNAVLVAELKLLSTAKHSVTDDDHRDVQAADDTDVNNIRQQKDVQDADVDVTNLRQEKSNQIVGLEKETNEFVKLLTQESDKLEITSIIGMAGLGKSTLAWKIFEHETIRFEFPVRIWMNVSQTLDMRKVLLEILSHLTTAKPAATKEALISQIQGHLEGKQFLIVLDDVWKVEDWDQLKALLRPAAADYKTGRVIITTRNNDVGTNNKMKPLLAHNLKFLSDEDSWKLLQYQVFGELGAVPEELQRLGQDIADDCKGLPLSIVVIGGILNKKTSVIRNNITAIVDEWEEVSERVKTYLVQGDVLKSIISLSYDKLPYELRNCFLYLGVFPEDANIPAKELIRLWIAEGFVKKNDDDTISLEEVARANLKNLINRNLLMVRVEKLDGEAKSCHIHDSIREVCKREGSKLSLFREILEPKLSAELKDARRLSVHSGAHKFFSNNPTLLKARSLHSTERLELAPGDMQSITNAFALLRVYNAKDMKFPSFPAKFLQPLIHLRYLTLAVANQLDFLPEVVTNLWNLQTLIVDTPSRTLELKGDIWKMRHLRHFKTHASIILKKEGEDTVGEELQTLSRLAPESCTEEVCKKAKSLITLGIQGNLNILEESRCLGKLESLIKLKLVNQVLPGAANNRLTCVPGSLSFPKSLKTLVLSGTRLDWSTMSTLSDIARLKVLKLKENAFEGDTWNVSGENFVNLVWLHINRADLRHWVDKTDHFPKLRFLEIKSCNKLREISLKVGKKLEVLTMENVTHAAVKWAETIVVEQNKDGRVVKLNISAADRK